ncbi:MAG: hypothetical protein OXI43_19480 [Candidatus Poribacteria bacterium]|nr:hypothetical protein [Candidatus Poribacteria bacterium]
MDIITEDYKMISARMRDGKGVSIRTRQGLLYAQLVVVNTVDRSLAAIIGTFPTFEIAEKVFASLRKAHTEGKLPWDVNKFKITLKENEV